jgi:hypothetical protein
MNVSSVIQDYSWLFNIRGYTHITFFGLSEKEERPGFTSINSSWSNFKFLSVEENKFLKCKPITDTTKNIYMMDMHNHNDKWKCQENSCTNICQFNSIQLYSCSTISTIGKVTSQIKSCTSHCAVIKYKQISMKLDTHYIYIYIYIYSNHQNITSIKHTLHRPKHKPEHGNLWGHFIKMILSTLKI